MANTIVPIELSSTPGIVDGSNATAITIDSSEDVTLAGHLVFADSKNAKFGAGSDLQIYHNGSHSYISDQGTGNMHILTNHLSVNNAADDEALFHITQDAGATMYNNGSEVMRIDSQGVHASLPAQAGVGKFGGTSTNAVSLADEGLLDISQGGTCGAWIVHVYERGSGAGAYYWCDYDGTVTLKDQEAAGGNGFDDSDGDGYYCLYKGDDSHTVYFKNRNGSTRSFMITIFGAEV
jgi:hypothetical protein